MYHCDEDVDNRGGYAGAGSILETWISTQLCYEPKTAQKISQCFFFGGGGGWGTRCSTLLSLKLDGTFPHLDFFLYVSPNKKHFISYLMFPFVCVESNL